MLQIKVGDYGTVDARDISQYKVDMIEENIHRTDCINVQAHCDGCYGI